MKTKNYKGITLIALIITIIVLLILAGVSISLVVGDNGILTQAVNAADSTDIAETKEAIELAVIGYYDENGEYTTADVAQAVADSGATLGEDGVTVTTAKGNTVDISDIVAGAGVSWEYDSDGNITNGIVTVAIGDYVNYTPSTGETYLSYYTVNGSSNQTFSSSDYTGTWRVMGVEDGKILLVSTGSVGSLRLYGQLGYQNGVNELNNICAIYGTGDYASSARSVTLDDLTSLFDYDYTNYGSGTIYEYGNEVTYSMNSDGKIAYSSTNSSGTSTQTGFYYYDEDSETWKSLSNSGDSATLTSTWWGNIWISADSSKSSEYSIISEDLYDLIILSDSYWLGSSCVYCDVGYAYFYVDFVYSLGLLGSDNLYYSRDSSYGDSWGVRAAVSLKSDISLISAGSNTWNISE